MFEDLFSPAKILLILVVVALLFGPQRLPEFGRSIGRAIRELQEGFRRPDEHQAGDDAEPPEGSEARRPGAGGLSGRVE
jgi:sec-independent protein translocase protein TatA